MALGALIDHFGQFVRDRHDPLPAAPSPAAEFPPGLADLHRNFGHHIILLGLLARADGEFAPAERAVIVGHCLALANRAGPVSDGARAALEDYAGCFRPALVQLDPALRRLSHDPPADVAALLGAAQALIEGDGVTRPEETRFLEGLKKGLAPAG